MAANQKFPTLYLPHGGGPCFFMEWTMGPRDTWDNMANWLRSAGEAAGAKPKAILLVSAHWETNEFTVSTAENPKLFFDYYGFPPHTYQLQYPAPGSPALAQQVRDLLNEKGLAVEADPMRGFDHGVFVPLKLVFPDADIPVVCLSLKSGLDPALHYQVGQALAPLREQGVFIIGSGMSYHNMGGFNRASVRDDSEKFDAWLTEVCALDDSARQKKLAEWSQAPAARACHPREEHLIPLMVIAGAGGADRGEKVFTDHVMAVAVSAFQFGAPISYG